MTILKQKLNKYEQVKEELGGVCAALKQNGVCSAGEKGIFLSSLIQTPRSFLALPCCTDFSVLGEKKGVVPSFIGQKLKYRTMPLKFCVWTRNFVWMWWVVQKVTSLHLTLNQSLFCLHFHKTGTWKLQSKCGLKLNRHNNLGSRAFLLAF